MQKRSQPDDDNNDETAVKKTKYETALVTINNNTELINYSGSRTSKLMAPEIVLEGHGSAVYSIAFDKTGQHLCSGSLDKNIFLWDVYGECTNYNVMTGHKSAVLQVCWPEPSTIVSSSADKTVACWDANKGLRIRKFSEHTGIVNSCSVARDKTNVIASGSDDCTVVLWDSRVKKSTGSIYHDYQICAVQLAHDGSAVYTAGIDNIIRRFDARKGDVEIADIELAGHTDIVTGLSLSPDGKHLLSNSMDCSLRCWDVRPFVAGGPAGDDNDARCECVLSGVHHGAEKLMLRCSWSADQNTVTCGSADRLVHMWETTTFQPLPAWPGHKASVNEVIFHPNDRVVASCSSDKTIILGELP